METNKPDAKVKAGGGAGILAAVAAALLHQAGVDVPDYVVAAFVTLLIVVVEWAKSDPRIQEAVLILEQAKEAAEAQPE